MDLLLFTTFLLIADTVLLRRLLLLCCGRDFDPFVVAVGRVSSGSANRESGEQDMVCSIADRLFGLSGIVATLNLVSIPAAVDSRIDFDSNVFFPGAT